MTFLWTAPNGKSFCKCTSFRCITHIHSCLYKLCKWIIHYFYYSHNAAISLGRSAPNRPKRWLLASRSKGEWLRMELKVNGYIARGNPVMWRTWCSLLVAIVKSAAGGLVNFSLTVLFPPPPASSSSGACGEIEVGCCHSAPLSCWLLCRQTLATKTWPGPDSVEKEGRERRRG